MARSSLSTSFDSLRAWLIPGMSGKKKQWRLSTPFQSLSPKLKTKVGRSGSRVSSVYLSDDSSASGFVIVPEFDCPVPTQAALEEPTHNSQSGPHLPSGPLLPNGGPINLEPIGSQFSHLGEGSFESREDDLAQRLGIAYEHIRSMPSAASPRVSLSSDPQLLLKQLGVPQHSVFNHPTHSSPDLPNPHPSPSESTSPGPPPPPDVSHVTTSNKLGLRINTDIDAYSSSSPDQEPIQPAQRKSAVTTPTLKENSPTQRSTLGIPWSAPIFGFSKSQESIPNSSKLAKRRADKTAHSSSPAGRQAQKVVLRKPNTPAPVNAHRRQISLPQMRPPSPFKVNIPLHHAWHDRRTNFNSFTKCHSDVIQHHEKNSRRTSGSTEILASLAWIGTSHTANWRRHLESTELIPDHFSMGIAVEDDSMSDDDLVDRLERVRRINSSDGGRNDPQLTSPSIAQFPSPRGDENMYSSLPPPPPSSPTSDQLAQPCDVPLSSSLISKDTVSDLGDAAVWQAARKAFLCIREIVRTEKKYQEALKMLLNAQTITPPPPSMSPYVSALVGVSELLLKRFLEDPSAWGVSTAFVTSEDELEASMVSWCTVAGGFFTDGNDSHSSGSTGRWRLRKSGIMSNPSSSFVTKQQTPTSLSPQLPPVFSTTSAADKWIADENYTGQHPPTEAEMRASTVSLQKPESTRPAPTCQPPSRKLSVRDLAIQPIQRVMRYVLLYRDLLNCTPAMSPPRLLVERALEAATRIANHCDRAQRNPAFSPAF